MKKISYITTVMIFTALCVVYITGCKKSEGYNTEPVSGDQTKPGVITNVQVKNFNGGAYITYSLPNSSNLLYVLAQYKINDKTSRQTKSSYYTDTVTVDGFAQSKDYEVTLYSVSRANVMSDPVTIKVHPDTPYYQLIKKTIQVTNDFSGVNITGLNQHKSDIGVVLIALDNSTQALEVQDQHYTQQDTINYSIRGFSAVPRKFGVYVTDKFGNISDTTITTLTPLFETALDKSKFAVYKTASDSPTAYGWELPFLWDNKTDGYSNGWHTDPVAPPPMQCTFGLGVLAQLSRFVLYERPLEYAYTAGNPKTFSVWGSSATSPADTRVPQSAPVGTQVGDWVNLGNYRFPNPPSGLTPGFTNAADEKFVEAGVDFSFSRTSPPVRFLRIVIHDTFSNGSYGHLMEITPFGKVQ